MLPPHLARQEQKAQRRQAILNQGIPPDVDECTLRIIMDDRRLRHRQRAINKHQAELERLYQGYPTRMLLMRLDQLRSVAWDREDTHQSDSEWAEERALRKILAMRPHIMRKQEAARHRAKNAHRQHGQGKSRNR